MPQKHGRAGARTACTRHVFRARTRRAHGASCAHTRRVSRRAEARVSRRAEQRVSLRAEQRVSRRAERRVSRHADGASSGAQTARILGVRRVLLSEPVCLNSGLVAVFFQVWRRLCSNTGFFGSLEGRREGCLLPGSTRRRSVLPSPAPPSPPRHAPPRPDRPVVCPGFGFDR